LLQFFQIVFLFALFPPHYQAVKIETNKHRPQYNRRRIVLSHVIYQPTNTAKNIYIPTPNDFFGIKVYAYN
jgi:hypothetical protein